MHFLCLLPAAKNIVDGEQLQAREPVRVSGAHMLIAGAKKMLAYNVLRQGSIEIVNVGGSHTVPSVHIARDKTHSGLSHYRR
ncbi:hypothetical protein SAMN05216315_11175 [Nitrosospira sp. Nsp18]|nr:hypothetical protein SAMN05216315_11175 [Nitrosospira sp. Nsp18]